MYKTRGRRDDPWNRRAAEVEKSIAEAINVRPLFKYVEGVEYDTRIPHGNRIETARRRQHFEAFRETYQQRTQKSRDEALKRNPFMVNSMEEYQERRSQILQSAGVQKTPSVKESDADPRVKYKRSVKTISVAAPSQCSAAIIVPPPREKMSLHADTSLVKQLQQTQEQIDEANSQLEQIQSLLRQNERVTNEPQRPSSSDTKKKKQTVGELYKKNPFAQYALLQSSHHDLDTFNEIKGKIGSPFPSGPYMKTVQNKVENSTKSVKSNKRQTATKEIRANKIKQTLKDVNDMIQKMQSKYFSKPRPNYKSVKSFGNNPVDVLFENNQFPANEIDKSAEGLKSKKSPHSFFASFAPKAPESSATKWSGGTTTTTTTSGTTGTTNESNEGMERIYQDSSSVRMIMSPKENTCTEEVSSKNITCCVGFKSTQDQQSSYYDLSQNADKSIRNSKYLMKELQQINKGRKPNIAASSSTGKKTVHFSTTETRYLDSESDRMRGTRGQVESFIKSALKDSLYAYNY